VRGTDAKSVSSALNGVRPCRLRRVREKGAYELTIGLRRGSDVVNHEQTRTDAVTRYGHLALGNETHNSVGPEAPAGTAMPGVEMKDTWPGDLVADRPCEKRCFQDDGQLGD
jgi:hypothetical protein